MRLDWCALAMATGGCSSAGAEGAVRVHDDFAAGNPGWKALFSDFAPDMTESMELEADMRPLPLELGLPGTGFYLQSMNRSDDVFMLLYRHPGQRDGVKPHAQYTVRFRIAMASDAPAGCLGAGGAPAEGVMLKVGAANHEPMVVIDSAAAGRCTRSRSTRATRRSVARR